MKEPLLAVVVPVYNRENYIERCIKSIQGQTYKNLEIIIVDDGSEDKSPQICMELADDDLRIEYIRFPENKGVVAARNAGINHAIRRGAELITFVDSDDWIENDLYRQMVEEIGDCDIAIEGWINIDSDIWKSPMKKGIYSGKRIECIWNEMFYDGGIWGFVWDKLYRVDIVRQIYKLIDDKLSGVEDMIFVHNYLLNCKTVRLSDVGGYHHGCLHEDSLYRKTIAQGFKILDGYANALIKTYSTHYYKEELLVRLYDDIIMWTKVILHDTLCVKSRGTFYYPYFGRLDGKRVILYGAGEVGRVYYREIQKEKEVELVLWVDKNYKSKGMDVCGPNMIGKVEYDYIIIGVQSEEAYVEIKAELLNMGVEEQKLLWCKTKCIWN